MKCYKLRYWFNTVWDNIRYWFNPRQKWLIKKIPNSWVDKDTLWELCILEGLKHYVEQDSGLAYYEESLSDPDFPEHQKQFDREAKENYELVSVRLPQLEAQLKIAWDNVPHFDIKNINSRCRDYDATYGKVDELEGTIEALKTKVMIWCVLNRASIWT